MRLINFSFDSSIELGFGGRECYLDLHNCFEWQGITYLSEERRVKMVWIGFPFRDRAKPDGPANLELEFRGVSKFAVCPRDPELPFTEDSCLRFATFMPPEFSSDFESEFEGYRSDAEHITFSFQSGFAVKIWAEEAELLLANDVYPESTGSDSSSTAA